LGSKSFSLWDQDVVIKVVGIEQLSFLVLDLLFKSCHFSIVDICSSAEFMMNVSQFFFQFTNEFLNFTVKFRENTSGLHVEFTEVQDEFTPT
jgi:hypothetical protein